MVCARAPSLTSVRGPGWLRAGDMMCDGVIPLGEALRPLGLLRPSTRWWRRDPVDKHSSRWTRSGGDYGVRVSIRQADLWREYHRPTARWTLDVEAALSSRLLQGSQ